MNKDEERETLLAIYAQINEYDRHYDTLGWTMGVIMIPVSFGIFAVAVAGFYQLSILLFVLLGGASTAALALWLLMVRRMYTFQQLRTRPRIQEIVRRLQEIDNVYGLEKLMDVQLYYAGCRHGLLSIRRLDFGIIVLTIAAWITLVVLKVMSAGVSLA
jgi:hypothetical protein